MCCCATKMRCCATQNVTKWRRIEAPLQKFRVRIKCLYCRERCPDTFVDVLYFVSGSVNVIISWYFLLTAETQSKQTCVYFANDLRCCSKSGAAVRNWVLLCESRRCCAKLCAAVRDLRCCALCCCAKCAAVRNTYTEYRVPTWQGRNLHVLFFCFVSAYICHLVVFLHTLLCVWVYSCLLYDADHNIFSMNII